MFAFGWGLVVYQENGNNGFLCLSFIRSGFYMNLLNSARVDYVVCVCVYVVIKLSFDDLGLPWKTCLFPITLFEFLFPVELLFLPIYYLGLILDHMPPNFYHVYAVQVTEPSNKYFMLLKIAFHFLSLILPDLFAFRSC